MIDSVAINLNKWNETYIFPRIDIHSNYKVICGLDDHANLQSSAFAYYTAPQYIEAIPVSFFTYVMRTLVFVGLAGLAGLAGYRYLSKRKENQGNEEYSCHFIHSHHRNETQPEEEKLLQNPSTLPTLSTETTAILKSLQPKSWRCSICISSLIQLSIIGQYLNDETATSCVMCHSLKDEKPDSLNTVTVNEPVSDEDFSDFDIQPTNSFAAQTVKPKEPPKIVRVNNTAESETDSTEDEPAGQSTVDIPAVSSTQEKPHKPEEEKVKETVVKSTMKPLPMKLRSTPGVSSKSTIVIKKGSTNQAKRTGRMKAKPAVIKVKKENDLFSELGMNAE